MQFQGELIWPYERERVIESVGRERDRERQRQREDKKEEIERKRRETETQRKGERFDLRVCYTILHLLAP